MSLTLPCASIAVQIRNAGSTSLYVDSVKVMVKDIWGFSYTAYADCPDERVGWTSRPDAYVAMQCSWRIKTW